MKNVRKFYDVSTAHLPQFTADSIEAGTFPREPTMRGEYGWLFSVPEAGEIVPTFDELGIVCTAYRNIFFLASDAGCDYVMFDRDAAPVDYLPIFDW